MSLGGSRQGPLPLSPCPQLTAVPGTLGWLLPVAAVQYVFRLVCLRAGLERAPATPEPAPALVLGGGRAPARPAAPCPGCPTPRAGGAAVGQHGHRCCCCCGGKLRHCPARAPSPTVGCILPVAAGKERHRGAAGAARSHVEQIQPQLLILGWLGRDTPTAAQRARMWGAEACIVWGTVWGWHPTARGSPSGPPQPGGP